MIDLKYLITGIPKGATTYMCRLLTSLDIMCGHESIFKHQGLEYAKRVIKGEIKASTSYCSMFDQLTNAKKDFNFIPDTQKAESSYMSAPYLSDPILNKTKIIFVVRNPWNILTSFHYAARMWHNPVKDTYPYMQFCELHVPEIKKEQTTLEKSIRFIISWFKIIEQTIPTNHLVFRAEEQKNQKLFEFLEISSKGKDIFNNTKENTWRKGQETPINKRQISKNLLEDWLNICDKYSYPLDNQENTKKMSLL